MKLPQFENAVVDQNKITKYLLDVTNVSNQDKPGFFTRFGFSLHDWRVLESALLEHAGSNDVQDVEAGEYGVKYRIVGALPSPDGRNPEIRSVWIVLHGEQTPRFVTAVPNQRRQK